MFWLNSRKTKVETERLWTKPGNWHRYLLPRCKWCLLSAVAMGAAWSLINILKQWHLIRHWLGLKTKWKPDAHMRLVRRHTNCLSKLSPPPGKQRGRRSWRGIKTIIASVLVIDHYCCWWAQLCCSVVAAVMQCWISSPLSIRQVFAFLARTPSVICSAEKRLLFFIMINMQF